MKPAATPELLAPAGNLETALAAYDAGADAVYCGLGKFNARERAQNSLRIRSPGCLITPTAADGSST